jgi:hypothetical protein
MEMTGNDVHNATDALVYVRRLNEQVIERKRADLDRNLVHDAAEALCRRLHRSYTPCTACLGAIRRRLFDEARGIDPLPEMEP